MTAATAIEERAGRTGPVNGGGALKTEAAELHPVEDRDPSAMSKQYGGAEFEGYRRDVLEHASRCGNLKHGAVN